MVEVISIHIPKTAGMAFRSVLEQVYPADQLLFDYDFPFNGSNVAPQIRMIHGHFWAEKYAGYFESADRIVWLRNPIYRLLSHYFFLKTSPGPEVRPDLAVMSLMEFAEYPQMRNLMARFVQGIPLTDFRFVGIQEFFSQDLLELSRAMGWAAVQPSVTNQNRYGEYTGHLYKILGNPTLMAKLRALNDEDIELYQWALSLREQRQQKSAWIGLPDRSTPPPALDDAAGSRLLSDHAASALSRQNALNLFQGEWLSKLPPPLDALQAGSIPLFEDDRTDWAIAELGGVEGQQILELGAVEGGTSYMLEQAGAAQVVSVEANPRAYLKCLVIKELLSLQRVQFLHCDYAQYLQRCPARFDACFAHGSLFLVPNPVELIALMGKRSDRLCLWTHYHTDSDEPSNSVQRLLNCRTLDYGGFQYQLYTYSPATSDRPLSYWMTREDILACLAYFGFNHVQIHFDRPDHPHGASLAVVATRTAGQAAGE